MNFKERTTKQWLLNAKVLFLDAHFAVKRRRRRRRRRTRSHTHTKRKKYSSNFTTNGGHLSCFVFLISIHCSHDYVIWLASTLHFLPHTKSFSDPLHRELGTTSHSVLAPLLYPHRSLSVSSLLVTKPSNSFSAPAVTRYKNLPDRIARIHGPIDFLLVVRPSWARI